MTDVRVFHQYAEVIVRSAPTVRVAHQYAEVVVRVKATVKAYHLYAEAVTRARPPARVSHLYAEVIVIPRSVPTPSTTVTMTLGPVDATEDGRLGFAYDDGTS